MMIKGGDNVIGQQLKQLRELHNLTQKDVAAALNITQTSYSYFENNKRSPDYITLKRLADYFNVKMSFLLGETETIISNTPNQIASSNKNFESFNELNEEGQKYALEYIEFLKTKYKK